MNDITELLSRRPKYMILADTFRKQIISGELPKNSRLQPDNELARKYQVNARTIAASLNKLVKEGLLERAPGRGTIVINDNKDRKKTSNAVGVVMLSKGDVYSDIARNIARGFNRHKLVPFLINGDVIFDGSCVMDFLNILNSEQNRPYGFIIDGCAEFPFCLIKEHIAKFKNIVFINRYLHYEKLGESKYAIVDFREAGRIAAKHFITQGCKKLFFLTRAEKPCDGAWGSMRIQMMEGFAEVCAENNIQSHEDIFWKLLRGAPVIDTINSLISSSDCPDAIFAHSDAFMRNELLPLLENTKDIELIGFYNTHHAEECEFSSICIHEEKIAENAIKLLTNKTTEKEIIIKPELIVRS